MRKHYDFSKAKGKKNPYTKRLRRERLKLGSNQYVKEVIVGERATPICKKRDCDIVENPSHWVDIELCEPYKSGAKLLELLKEAQARIFMHDGMSELYNKMGIAITVAMRVTDGA